MNLNSFKMTIVNNVPRCDDRRCPCEGDLLPVPVPGQHSLAELTAAIRTHLADLSVAVDDEPPRAEIAERTPAGHTPAGLRIKALDMARSIQVPSRGVEVAALLADAERIHRWLSWRGDLREPAPIKPHAGYPLGDPARPANVAAAELHDGQNDGDRYDRPAGT